MIPKYQGSLLKALKRRKMQMGIGAYYGTGHKPRPICRKNDPTIRKIMKTKSITFPDELEDSSCCILKNFIVSSFYQELQGKIVFCIRPNLIHGIPVANQVFKLSQ